MTLYELIEQPELEQPVLILALEGWIDAGMAASLAGETLTSELDVVTVARFSTDELLDYRARRPLVHMVDGVLKGLTWPSIELQAMTDTEGNELLLLVGAEPDRLWHAFTDDVVTLALELGVRMCIGLGAYPFALPHTRTPQVACTASTPSLAHWGFVTASLDFPAGVQAAIEQRCDSRGIPALGMWAQVPHYLPPGMPYPAASVALLESAGGLGELSLPLGDLPARAAATRARLDELIAQNPEHEAMLRQLESAHEQAVGPGTLRPQDIPTGDELAEQFERFLRNRGTGPDG